jgi:hypothetical protein
MAVHIPARRMLLAGGGAAATMLFVAGHGGLRTTDLERWGAGEPAWESPALFAPR